MSVLATRATHGSQFMIPPNAPGEIKRQLKQMRHVERLERKRIGDRDRVTDP
jgi:hypothetical protein